VINRVLLEGTAVEVCDVQGFAGDTALGENLLYRVLQRVLR